MNDSHDLTPSASSPDISITLASLDSVQIKQFVSHINEVLDEDSVEICVCTPADLPPLRRTTVVKEVKRLGNIGAHNKAFMSTKGRIIIAMNDDTRILNPTAFRSLISIIDEREKLTFPFCLGLNGIDCPHFGTVYGYYYPFFPVMSRRSIEAIGGWYDCIFKTGWADPDIGLRVWSMGGRCELMREKTILTDTAVNSNEKSRTCFSNPNIDLDIFIKRWHHRYGRFFFRQAQDINHNYHYRMLKSNTFAKAVPPWICYLQFSIIDMLLKNIYRTAMRMLIHFIPGLHLKARK